jgi:preprotein translocase subunit SecB
MSEENNGAVPASDEQRPEAAAQFVIQRIYLKDISFETPMGIEAFSKQIKPTIQQDLSIQVNPINNESVEVILLITVTATIEGRTVFLVEVKQAGLFTVVGIYDAQLTQVINIACPQILFPYAREAVDSILSRGGFPPIMLPPINFDAVFAQAVEAVRQQSAAAPEAATN